MKRAASIVWAFWASTCAAQVQVVQREVEIGSPGISYRDPEFLLRRLSAGADQGLVAWIDQNRRIRVGEINLATGGLLTPTGQIVGVGASYTTVAGNPPILGSYNGPEWGQDAAGPAVYYSGYDASGIMQIFRHRAGSTSQATVAQDAPSGLSPRGSAIATIDATAPDTRFFYFLDSVLSGRFAWRIDGSPSSEVILSVAEINTSGPRWIPGTRSMVLNVPVGGVNQAAIYDTDAPGLPPRVITTDAFSKSDMFFYSPVPDGQATHFFASLEGASATGGQAIGIYAPEEGTGLWTLRRVIDVLASPGVPVGADYFSAEPFAMGCRTWVSLAVSDGANFTTPARVYVVSVEGGPLIEVSAASSLLRADPEVLALSDRAYVYYYTQPEPPANISRLFLSEIRAAGPACRGDADQNRVVTFADVTSVLSNFGASGGCNGDADGNGTVNFADVTSVLSNFLLPCP